MKVNYKNEKVKNLCEDPKYSRRHFGDVAASRLKQRIRLLLEAENLSDISHRPPPRLHLLSGYTHLTFSIDVHHGLRIVLEPADRPLPLLDDGGIDKRNVRAVHIVTVEDYHD